MARTPPRRLDGYPVRLLLEPSLALILPIVVALQFGYDCLEGIADLLEH